MTTASIPRLAVWLLAALLAAPVAALDLDEARGQGLVGERVDGFVGAVPGDPPAEVRALVERVNAQRRQHYAQIAREQGIAAEAVAARAGEKLVAKTPAGQWVAGANGRWRKK